MSDLIPVFSMPTPGMAAQDSSNGIAQVVLNLAKHLPKYGYTLTENPNEAAIFLPHAGAGYGAENTRGIPMLAVIHGLYPSGEPDSRTEQWHYATNARVIDDLRRADEVIVPSEWVAEIIARDMRFKAHVIGWGVDTDVWKPLANHEYILWNKNRDEGVCNPAVLDKLAIALPHRRFVTTFGNPQSNVAVIGRISHDDMLEVVGHAGLYLATTRETFGLATLEAESCGVPIVGYNWAGTAQLVEHGINGYLTPPNDIDALIEGIEWCFTHRDTLSHNARFSAGWWSWEHTAESFAEVFDKALNKADNPIKVSVVVPSYNYGQYLKECITSIATQETDFDFEVLISDDGSTDGTRETVAEILQNLPSNPHLSLENIHYLHHENRGVAFTRNRAIKEAKSDYIAAIDADDMMAQGFLQICKDALDKQADLAIAFTGITIMGSNQRNGWPSGYDYDLQVNGENQVPSLCLFRKKYWQRVGGYKQRYAPAEDARLWLDIGAIGGKAKQVTYDGLFLYRVHADSQSRIKPAVDWRSDKSWITNGQRPFASDGKPRLYSYPVRNYDRPLVSIIIPVGVGHEAILYDALDSVESQTDHRWEVIVINDTGAKLALTPYPYVRLYETAGKVGASTARNIGIQAARGSFVTFLDADDILYPTFLRQTLAAYERTGYYAYTDWDMITKTGEKETHECPEFTPNRIFEQGYFHPITCLIPTQWLKDIGGFADEMETWEDVDLFMQLVSRGYCGTRVKEPLMLYRYTTGSLREKGYNRINELKTFFRTKYHDYIVGGKNVVCSCGGAKKPVITNQQQALAANNGNDKNGPMLLVEYHSPMKATHPVVGLNTKQNYGSRSAGEVFYVYQKDIAANPTSFSEVQINEPPTAERILPPEPVLLGEFA